MSKFRFAVLASGEGSNLQALIDEVHRRGVASLVLVLSDNEGAMALERARLASVPAVALPPLPREGRKSYHQRVGKVLAAVEPDLIVLAGYMPCSQVHCRAASINVHLAAACLSRPPRPCRLWIMGQKITGCTVHWWIRMDTGPVICRRRTVLPPTLPTAPSTP